MKKIKIVYGTVGGNTELVCERAKEIFETEGHTAEMLKAKLTDPAKLGDYDLLILACPTYGIGELEEYFEIFLDKLDGVDLKGKNTAIIGLGDPKYDQDYHLESAKIIMDFLKKKEAVQVYMPLRITKCPLPLIEQGFVDNWVKKVSEKLINGQ